MNSKVEQSAKKDETPLKRSGTAEGLFMILLLGDSLKGKSGVDKTIVKEQPYQLLNTNHEFFPSFDASNFYKLVDQFS